MIASPDDAEIIPFVSLDQIPTREVNWLWSKRIALGKLTMLDGDPGLGKSLVTLDLAARVTTGRTMPDGQPGLSEPADVVILNGEDSAEDTIGPRALGLGADMRRVHLPSLSAREFVTPMLFPTHWRSLHQVLTNTRAKLVVIDPIMQFLERSVMSSNDQAVRRALAPLAALAECHQCAIVLVRHLNKSGGVRSLYRGSGTIGFVGTCRAAWLIAADPGDPSRRVFAQEKNSLAEPQPSLAFTVIGADSKSLAPAWLGMSPLTADQLLAGALGARPERLAPREEASRLLKEFLTDGPRTAREVWEFVVENHLAERTVKRAKEDLEIVSKRVRLDGERFSYWLLPGQQLPAHVPPEAVELDLIDLLQKQQRAGLGEALGNPLERW